MKKVYAKPQIMFEDFSLSTSIANCQVPTNAVEGECGIVPDGFEFSIFGLGWSGCEFGNPDKICYDNPYTLNDLFSS